MSRTQWRDWMTVQGCAGIEGVVTKVFGWVHGAQGASELSDILELSPRQVLHRSDVMDINSMSDSCSNLGTLYNRLVFTAVKLLSI